jgi:hypothetical protein
MGRDTTISVHECSNAALRFTRGSRQVNVRVCVVALLVLCACGSAQSSGSLPLPSPPTAALAAWKHFPATANPRPIIAFGATVEHIPQAGFPTNDRKIAWICNKFVLASDVKLSTTPPGPATAAGSSYPSIGSERAYFELMSARSSGGNSTDCARVQPFLITAARWGTAGFPTDRGTVQMSAWLFDVPEVSAYIGHSAVDPSAYWGGGVASGGRGARISADDRTLKIPVSNAEPGPCGTDYTTATAESDTAAAVAVKSIPHASPGDAVACPLVLHLGYITVVLNAPLAGRVLVDEQGKAGSVCPETGDC